MIRTFLIAITILVSSLSYGQTQADNQKYKRLVNDYANILSNNEENALEHKLVAYDDSTSTQIAVVTIESLNGNEISGYSFQLAEKMGIGRKDKNNGILILVAMKEHKMFIATGYGMEGVVTDALAKRIVENYMKPNFRNNDFYKGIDEATTVIMALASGEYTADQIKGSNKNYSGIVFPLLLLLFFIISSLSRYRRAKSSHLAGSNLSFWAFMLLMSNRGHSSGSGFGSFSSGSGSFGGGGFGGFGGGSFGGGGAGGGW